MILKIIGNREKILLIELLGLIKKSISFAEKQVEKSFATEYMYVYS